MALADRLRSCGVPLLKRIVRSTNSFQSSKTYSASARQENTQVKIPMALFGGTGNYATSLFVAAKRANMVDAVEAEILNLVEASKKSPTFFQFTKDLSVPSDTRMKAMMDIASHAKFSEITKNFLVLLAEKGRLGYVEDISKKYSQLTMADRGEMRVTVTTVIPLPPEEEKLLKEALLDLYGSDKVVHVEQKVDPSILGGLVIESGQTLIDLSIRTSAQQMERLLREPIDISSV